MKIADQLKLMREAFAAWALAFGGSAAIAADPAHLFGLLMTKPGAVRACILFDSETPVGEIDEGGKVERKFLVCISRGRGFTLSAAESLTDESGRGAAMFDLIETAREVGRGLVFAVETTDGAPAYAGCRRVELEGLVVDAYQLEFNVVTQLALPIATSETSELPES